MHLHEHCALPNLCPTDYAKEEAFCLLRREVMQKYIASLLECICRRAA
jgi:hypothetical protein